MKLLVTVHGYTTAISVQWNEQWAASCCLCCGDLVQTHLKLSTCSNLGCMHDASAMPVSLPSLPPHSVGNVILSTPGSSLALSGPAVAVTTTTTQVSLHQPQFHNRRDSFDPIDPCSERINSPTRLKRFLIVLSLPGLCVTDWPRVLAFPSH